MSVLILFCDFNVKYICYCKALCVAMCVNCAIMVIYSTRFLVQFKFVLPSRHLRPSMLQHLLRRLVFDVPILNEYAKMPLKVK